MVAQAKTTREQSNKKNIYDVGWRPSHGKNGGVGKQKKSSVNQIFGSRPLKLYFNGAW